MNISEITSLSEKPQIYERGTSVMWADEHVSKQLLEIHLNPDIDLGSRRKSSIEKTADWIQSTNQDKGKLNILDLGCGPGLYTELFAKAGHQVTGVDISASSIDYAIKSAADKNLDITYLNANYLDLDLDTDQYDLIVMIYTDFGVLLPDERGQLLEMIYRILKKGGTFIFDVLKDHKFEEKVPPKDWESMDRGFWKNEPYVALSESFLYEKEKVILFQHLIIDQQDHIEIYRFWTHFFSQHDMLKILEAHSFCDITVQDDILPEGDMWNGDNVFFVTARK